MPIFGEKTTFDAAVLDAEVLAETTVKEAKGGGSTSWYLIPILTMVAIVGGRYAAKKRRAK